METKFNEMTRRTIRSRWSLFVIAIIIVLTPGGFLAQPILDLCGCAGTPGLQPFDAGTPSTYPAGTSGCASNCSTGTITLQIPADGIFRFSSFTANGGFNIQFARNAANSPVTILVAGNVLLRGANGCCQSFSLSGSAVRADRTAVSQVSGAPVALVDSAAATDPHSASTVSPSVGRASVLAVERAAHQPEHPSAGPSSDPQN